MLRGRGGEEEEEEEEKRMRGASIWPPPAGRAGSCRWSGSGRAPAEIRRDMTALTPNKEEQHYDKLIALIDEWEAAEISEELVVPHSDRARGADRLNATSVYETHSLRVPTWVAGRSGRQEQREWHCDKIEKLENCFSVAAARHRRGSLSHFLLRSAVHCGQNI